MISRTPENRMLYDARLKFQRDEESRLRRARQEGRSEGIEEGLQLGLEKGLAKGAIAGRINLLQQLLNLPQATISELTGNELSELVGLEEQLQHQLRSGRS